MEDSPIFTGILDRPYFVIAEVKTECCNLNGPWTKQDLKNMQEVVAAIGFCPSSDIDTVARALYKSGQVTNPGYFVSLLCLGNTRNPEILAKYPAVPQVTWEEVLKFVYVRFRKYNGQKVSHQQWDKTGHQLWDEVQKSKDDLQFISRIKIIAPTPCGC